MTMTVTSGLEEGEVTDEFLSPWQHAGMMTPGAA
jgi:hypothetical protein